jgi:F-type H+/Na+-transporting ATPase subunit alpha
MRADDADAMAGGNGLLVRARSFRFAPRFSERGWVVAVGDGIAWIEGLPSVAMDEVLRIGDGSRALVFQLERELIGAILLDQTPRVAAGSPVERTGAGLSIGVGDALIGRVIDPLGVPLDGQPRPDCAARRVLDAASPPIVARDFVNEPLVTGNKLIDALIPIGKGQRQLIVGDSGTGKSALALDIVVNQRGKNVRCVYVLIGQKRSTVISTIQTLRAAGALAHTTVVAAEATAMPGLKYLAPFAGCAVAEDWMSAGQDSLIVYDDLTTHARSYRELSLLLRRPPGREAYPGDIFYLHSRLLERSTRLAPMHSGGSMTALPLIETEQGEIAAYIPTNLISITDGQIYLDQALFSAGMLPAIDIARSVSRIGGKAQDPRVRKAAGPMKLDYLQSLELEVFTRFGTQLEPAMEAKIRRGRVLREAFRQERLAPVSIEFQLAWMTAFNLGLLDAIAPEEVPTCLRRLEERVSASGLPITAGREDWEHAVRSWLASSLPE